MNNTKKRLLPCGGCLSICVILFMAFSFSFVQAANQKVYPSIVEAYEAILKKRGLQPTTGKPTPKETTQKVPAKPEQNDHKKLATSQAELEKKFVPVAAVYGQVSKDRQELQAMRDKLMQDYTKLGMKSNCMQLAGKITLATMTYVNQRIAETVKKLGPAPTRFAIFTMGSMARDESGFFTDLEIGILVKEKNPQVVNYFKHFSQQLADRFFLLGEHPDVGGKGLRIDEADNAPAHMRFYARYATPVQAYQLYKKSKAGFTQTSYEGSRIFFATPKEFASLLDPKFPHNMLDLSDNQIYTMFDVEFAKAQKSSLYKGLSQEEIRTKVWEYVNNVARPLTEREKEVGESVVILMRNIRYLYGDKTIFDQFIKERDVYLNGQSKNKSPHYTNRREEIAYAKLNDDIKKDDRVNSPIATGTLGDEIDLKRKVYRFPEQVLTNLGFMYNVGVQNTAQIADKLVATKRMSPQWGNALKDLMNFVICLRLRKQMAFGKQGFAIPVTQKGYDNLKQKYTQELGAAKAKVASLEKSKGDARLIAQAQEQASALDVALRDLERMIPGKPDSILTPEIINALNTKYLPLEKKLLETAKKFIGGDKKAFLGTDVGIVAAPMTQPKKK